MAVAPGTIHDFWSISPHFFDGCQMSVTFPSFPDKWSLGIASHFDNDGNEDHVYE